MFQVGPPDVPEPLGAGLSGTADVNLDDQASEHADQSLADSHVAILAVQAGDSSAIGRLTQSLRPFLKHVVREELRGGAGRVREDESDLVQQALAQAVENAQGFRGQSLAEWRAWLAAIARNQARLSRRYWRAGRRDLSRSSELGSGLLEPGSGRSTPSHQAIRAENLEQLSRAMSSLSVDQQQLIRWRQTERMPHSEIAARLGIQEEAARQRCKSAMDALRKAWRAGQPAE